MLRKSKATKAEPEIIPASLEDQIRAAQAAALEFVEGEIAKIKKSPEGATLPEEWIRQNIYAVHFAKGCVCRCALSILDKETKQ